MDASSQQVSSEGGLPLGLSLPALRAFIAPMSASSPASLREAAAGRATPVARLLLSQVSERVVTAATRDRGSGSLAEVMLKEDEEMRALSGSCAHCGGIAAFAGAGPYGRGFCLRHPPAAVHARWRPAARHTGNLRGRCSRGVLSGRICGRVRSAFQHRC